MNCRYFSLSLRLILTQIDMRLFVVCFAALISSALCAQSKKELQAEVNQLKAAVTQLTIETQELKKPKEVDLNGVHKKASYGLGVLMAANVRRQGGDSLDVVALTAGIEDVFFKKALKIDEQQ